MTTSFFRSFAVDLDHRCPLAGWNTKKKKTPKDKKNKSNDEKESSGGTSSSAAATTTTTNNEDEEEDTLSFNERIFKQNLSSLIH